MRLDTAINKKRELTQAYHALWREALLFKLAHADILKGHAELRAHFRSMPEWAKSYCEGVYDTLATQHYQHLEFCYTFNGLLYSTDKTTTQYSTTEEFYRAGRGELLGMCKGRHYYKGTKHAYYEIEL